jgi:hypothetical protein
MKYRNIISIKEWNYYEVGMDGIYFLSLYLGTTNLIPTDEQKSHVNLKMNVLCCNTNLTLLSHALLDLSLILTVHLTLF